MERVPKLADTGRNTQLVVELLFKAELDRRLATSQHFVAVKPNTPRATKAIQKLCASIGLLASQLDIPVSNLIFVYLNRVKPVHATSVSSSLLGVNWEEFVYHLSQDKDLLVCLNYDATKRQVVRSIIAEFIETPKSKAFTSFMTDKCKGYKVTWPEHWHYRSRLFETVLIMLKQLEDHGLHQYIQMHASKILQTHLQYFTRFGDPIRLSLGCFIGTNAMQRLMAVTIPDAPVQIVNSKTIEYTF